MCTFRFVTLFLMASVANVIAMRQLHEETLSPKEVAMRFYYALHIEKDKEKVSKYSGPNFIQHSPFIQTGPEAVLDHLQLFQDTGLVTINHRFIGEGDLVVFHSTYKNAEALGAKILIGLSVFRVENGKVDEHWGNLQRKSGPNPSGRSMTGGRKKVKDLPEEETMANKALVQGLIDTVFIDGDTSRAGEFISSEKYIQHNPNLADGLDTLIAAVESSSSFSFKKLHMIVAEGDFVFTASEATSGPTPIALFDLFRCSKGKIVEHWDVVSPIPEEDFVHGNGFF